MNDFNTQMKIQAFLDGELPEAEAREIAALIARDRDAAALHTELKNTRRALAGAEQGITLPETREFYWSKISREIEKTERAEPVQAAPTLWQMLSRLLKPVVAVAVVVLAGFLVFHQTGTSTFDGGVLVASVDEDVITYRDEANDTTYVLFSYPAENAVANDANDATLN